MHGDQVLYNPQVALSWFEQHKMFGKGRHFENSGGLPNPYGKSEKWMKLCIAHKPHGGFSPENAKRAQSGSLLHPADSDTGDTMMLSIYVALGLFLLIAVRNPSAHRSLIAFAAWSSFAHAVAMSILGLEIASQRVGFLVGSAVLVVIGVALIVLAPGKQSGELRSAAST